MLKFLILAGTAGLILLIWQANRARQKRLAAESKSASHTAQEDGTAQKADSADKDGHHAPVDMSLLFEPPRALSPLDVTMIQARFDKLELWENFSEYQSDRLRQMILEMCQGGEQAHWWSPLVGFSKYLDYQKGELPAVIIDATRLAALQVRRHMFTFDYHMRRSGIHLDDIQTEKGEEIEPEARLSDGVIKVVYKFKDRAFRFPVNIADGRLDIPGLVRTLNGLLARRRASRRFVLLPPHGETWCAIHCVISTAEQVHRSRWGVLLLPEIPREEDVERVSEDLHSVVEPPQPTDETEQVPKE